MSITAKTPKGKTVTIETVTYGTANQGGRVYFGGILLSAWEGYGTGLHTLEEALQKADERIEANGLQATE